MPGLLPPLCTECDSRTCHHTAVNFTSRLTKRELDLVLLLAKGLANKEIAYRLGISEGTTKVYTSRLFWKLGMTNRWEVGLWAASAAKALEFGARSRLEVLGFQMANKQ